MLETVYGTVDDLMKCYLCVDGAHVGDCVWDS